MSSRNENIHVVAHLHAQPASVEATLAVLTELARNSRDEPGNLRFQVHQSAADPTRFVAVEHWIDAAAADAHMQGPRVAAVLAKLGPLLAGPPDIVRYLNIA